MTKATAAPSQPPVNNQEFESLTLALDDWFDKNLKDLPIALRQRVEREFPPIPWEELSADQRCILALQLNYLRDPATGQRKSPFPLQEAGFLDFTGISRLSIWWRRRPSHRPNISLNYDAFTAAQKHTHRHKYRQFLTPKNSH